MPCWLSFTDTAIGKRQRIDELDARLYLFQRATRGGQRVGGRRLPVGHADGQVLQTPAQPETPVGSGSLARCAVGGVAGQAICCALLLAGFVLQCECK